MKRALLSVLLVAILVPDLEAARVRVTRRGPHGRVTRVTVRTTRPAPVVRVTPRVWLAPVTFGAVVVASAPDNPVWRDTEVLQRADGWTDFTMNVDRRGDRMLIEIERGAAQISSAEIVFDNGDAQVVDFNDRTYGRGLYSLMDFKDGRKVDHVRVVAKASSAESEITLRLVS